MFLVVGLGNPGEKYHNTRHNVGFYFLDSLAGRLGVDFSATKWQALAVKAICCRVPVLLVKPQTYMNLSGNALAAAASYYKIPPAKIIVIHDDLDMPLGRVKIVVNRGAGGHNGIRSIISHFGKNDFVRIKVGIGRPDSPMPVDRYVLTKMNQDEMSCVAELNDVIYDAISLLVADGVEKAMNKINSMDFS